MYFVNSGVQRTDLMGEDKTMETIVIVVIMGQRGIVSKGLDDWWHAPFL